MHDPLFTFHCRLLPISSQDLDSKVEELNVEHEDRKSLETKLHHSEFFCKFF